MDPELAHYLNRNYWQQKQQDAVNDTSVPTTTPSAPVAMSEPKTSSNQKIHEVKGTLQKVMMRDNLILLNNEKLL